MKQALLSLRRSQTPSAHSHRDNFCAGAAAEPLHTRQVPYLGVAARRRATLQCEDSSVVRQNRTKFGCELCVFISLNFRGTSAVALWALPGPAATVLQLVVAEGSTNDSKLPSVGDIGPWWSTS